MSEMFICVGLVLGCAAFAIVLVIGLEKLFDD